MQETKGRRRKETRRREGRGRRRGGEAEGEEGRGDEGEEEKGEGGRIYDIILLPYISQEPRSPRSRRSRLRSPPRSRSRDRRTRSRPLLHLRLKTAHNTDSNPHIPQTEHMIIYSIVVNYYDYIILYYSTSCCIMGLPYFS